MASTAAESGSGYSSRVDFGRSARRAPEGHPGLSWREFGLVLFLASAIAGFAQKPEIGKLEKGSCEGTHRPGDRLTCLVTFAGPTDFSHVEVVFNLPKEDKPSRYGSAINLVLRESQKVDARTYAVSGLVPDCVPGTYILAAVTAGAGHDWQLYQNLGDMTIKIENDSGDSLTIDRTVQQMRDQQTRSPQIVQTPPPDPAAFPRIELVWGVRAPASGTRDVVGFLTWIFRKPDSCASRHGQGDVLRCRIKFAGDPKFTTVVLHFLRDEKHASRYQSQQCIGFGLGTDDSAPGRHGVYEVTGAIPKCGSGRYRVSAITAFTRAASDVETSYVKVYVNGSDFTTPIVLKLKDTAHNRFPEIVAVRTMPGEQ